MVSRIKLVLCVVGLVVTLTWAGYSVYRFNVSSKIKYEESLWVPIADIADIASYDHVQYAEYTTSYPEYLAYTTKFPTAIRYSAYDYYVSDGEFAAKLLYQKNTFTMYIISTNMEYFDDVPITNEKE